MMDLRNIWAEKSKGLTGNLLDPSEYFDNFAIDKIQRIGHDRQAPFFWGISSGDKRQKQAAT